MAEGNEIKLVKASITRLDDPDNSLEVLFNPTEYVLSKQAFYSEIYKPGSNTSYVQFSSGRRRQLRVELFFDTTDTGDDVSEYTKKLESFMELAQEDDKEGKESAVPLLFFEWGSFKFECVLEDLRMQFTKFGADGTPLRVIVRTVFSEYVPLGAEADSQSGGQ